MERLELMGVTFDAGGNASGGTFSPAEMTRMGVVQIAKEVVAWNWVDSDDTPLPQPDPNNPEATADMMLEKLREVEIDYLIATLKEFHQGPANLRKSGNSSKR
jgi:predicted Zn-dependent protease